MSKEKSKFDLGSSKVWKTFLIILVPTLIAQLISGTFVIFDTFFVSRGFHAGAVGEGIGGSLFADNSAYASLGPTAVSYAMPYTFFIIGFGLAIGAGIAALMTKQLSRNDKVGMQRSMNSYLPLSIIFGVIIMLILLIFSKVLVWFGSGFSKEYLNSWFNNPLFNKDWSNALTDLDLTNSNSYRIAYEAVNGHILQQASWFLKIQAIGAIPYVYMVGGVIMLRVQGKAQYATAFSSIGLIVNIALDFVFILVLKMNVVGAAIATIIGQYATALAYFIYFQWKSELKHNKLDWKYSFQNVGIIMRSGVSIMMLQVLTGMILIIFTFTIGVSNKDMYNVTNYTAVYQGYNAIFIFLNLVIIGIAQSMKPIVGYNHSINDDVNVKKARNIGIGSSLVFSIIFAIIVVVFSQQVISVFYRVDGSAVDYITTGNIGANGGILDNEVILNNNEVIFTNGMKVAASIVRILFITFPIAVMISVCSTYLQGIEQDRKAFILLFGKPILILILILIFAFWFPSAFTSEWIFTVKNISGDFVREITKTADLGLFLTLPIVDVIVGLLLIYFLIDSEINVIKKYRHGEAVIDIS